MERLTQGAMRKLSNAELIDQNSVPVTETGCWIWLGAVMRSGYGCCRNTTAHKLSYESFVGPVPHDYEVDHRCYVRICVNPAHLRAVTHAKNMEYARQRRTHCRGGHQLTEENQRIRIVDGYHIRECRECHRIRELKRYHRMRRMHR